MRAMKSERTAKALMNGYRIYYNFIRPHMALNHTPAEEANINLTLGTNKWLSLIRKPPYNKATNTFIDKA